MVVISRVPPEGRRLLCKEHWRIQFLYENGAENEKCTIERRHNPENARPTDVLSNRVLSYIGPTAAPNKGANCTKPRDPPRLSALHMSATEGPELRGVMSAF